MKAMYKEQMTYLCDSEEEASAIIESFKEEQENGHYTVSRYKSDFKKKKNKITKEQVEYWVVTVEKKYDSAFDLFFN